MISYRYELQTKFPHTDWSTEAASTTSIRTALGNYKKSGGNIERKREDGAIFRIKTIKITEEIISIEDYEAP